MQVVVVNCDKRKEEYSDHMKKLSTKYLAVPFESLDIATKLEDMAQAANIPRAAVFTVRKGFAEFAVKDIKKSILKSATIAEAVTEVIQ